MRHMKTIAVWGERTGRVHMISHAMYYEFLRRGHRMRVIATRSVIPFRGVF